jgi:ATP-dependent DNA helicase RecG
MSKEIIELIKKGESQSFEFKESFNEGVLKTISAFANTKGGTILIGVSDNKEVVGFKISDKDLEAITNKIVDSLGFTPEIENISINKRNLLKIEVQKSSVPISCKGIYYKRVGNTTREMTFEDLSRFFRRDLRWEVLTNDKFKLEDLDEEVIKNFLALGREKGRLIALNDKEPNEDILTKIGLIESGRITNACMLLFGKNPQQFFFGAKTRVVRLKDNITIIGDRWIQGNLFTQYTETEEAIKNNINVRYEIKGFEREDIWDYPLPALREAIANALVHRDYFKQREIQIKIYDDKIWFNNLGGLAEEMSLEQLLKAHTSKPRNPLIAHIFYLAGIIESVGSGIERMRNSLKSMGLPELKIEANHSEFNLWFMKDIYTEEYLRSLGLNDRQIRAVIYVKERGRITNKEYQEILGVSKKTASRDFEGLVNLGVFEKVGITGKGTYYSLKGSQRSQTGHNGVIKGSKDEPSIQ